MGMGSAISKGNGSRERRQGTTQSLVCYWGSVAGGRIVTVCWPPFSEPPWAPSKRPVPVSDSHVPIGRGLFQAAAIFISSRATNPTLTLWTGRAPSFTP